VLGILPEQLDAHGRHGPHGVRRRGTPRRGGGGAGRDPVATRIGSPGGCSVTVQLAPMVADAVRSQGVGGGEQLARTHRFVDGGGPSTLLASSQRAFTVGPRFANRAHRGYGCGRRPGERAWQQRKNSDDDSIFWSTRPRCSRFQRAIRPRSSWRSENPARPSRAMTTVRECVGRWIPTGEGGRGRSVRRDAMTRTCLTALVGRGER
jgi:hypothetical protein